VGLSALHYHTPSNTTMDPDPMVEQDAGLSTEPLIRTAQSRTRLRLEELALIGYHTLIDQRRIAASCWARGEQSDR
jgi:hypothetical protein